MNIMANNITILLLLIIIISATFNAGHFCKIEEVELIKDFIRRTTSPTVVIALLNWKRGDLLSFSKSINDINTRHTIINSVDESTLNSKNSHHHLYVVDLSSIELKEFIIKTNDSDLFGVYHKWFILNINPEKLNVLSQFEIFRGSKVYISEKLENNDTNSCYKINAVYRTRNSTEFNQDHIALWSFDKGFHYYNELIISRNRSDLMGEVVTIGGVIFDPDSLEHMWDFRNTHLDVLTKSSYHLTHEVTRVMNASIAYRIYYAWEYRGNLSEIDPLLQDFIHGRMDISGTVIAGVKSRLHIVEYVASTTPASVAFLLKEPPLSAVHNLYTLTFGTDVWIACGLLILLAFVPLKIIFGWEWFLTHPEHENYHTNPNQCNEMMTVMRRNGVSDMTLIQAEVICQQGSNIDPKSISGRILLFTLLIAFMFLYTSFSGNIVALLQSTSDSINTLEDLLTSRIKLGSDNLAFIKHFFAVEEEPLRKKIYNTKIAPKGQQNNFISMKEGIEKVRTEFYAFHCELTSATQIIRKTFQEHEGCGLKTIPFLSLLGYNVIKKNSTFRDLFTVNIRKLGEYGIERRFARKVFTSLPVCAKSPGIFIAVGISDCYFVFLLFSVGAGISIIIFIFEKLFKR